MSDNKICTAMFCAASCLVAASAVADTVVLDFDSGDFFGAPDARFSVDPLRLDWTDGADEFATNGVLFAISNGPGANGVLYVESTGPDLLELVSLQLGGRASTPAEASVGYHVWQNESWNFVEQNSFEFSGSDDLFSYEVNNSIVAKKFAIVLDNFEGLGSVGLDNVAFNIVAVPAPGALALLGVAGIFGKRRRRTA